MNNRMTGSVATIAGCMMVLVAVAVMAGCSGTAKCPFSSCPCNAGPAQPSCAPAASPSGGSCAGGNCAGGSCAPAQPAKAANATCPVSGDKIQGQAQFVRQFNGRGIAFCSQFCAEQWDRLSDQEKQAKLDKVLNPK